MKPGIVLRVCGMSGAYSKTQTTGCIAQNSAPSNVPSSLPTDAPSNVSFVILSGISSTPPTDTPSNITSAKHSDVSSNLPTDASRNMPLTVPPYVLVASTLVQPAMLRPPYPLKCQATYPQMHQEMCNPTCHLIFFQLNTASGWCTTLFKLGSLWGAMHNITVCVPHLST